MFYKIRCSLLIITLYCSNLLLTRLGSLLGGLLSDLA